MLTVFSAIQATGKVHLGNYFGLLNFYLRHQRNHKDILRPDTARDRQLLAIADLHGLTNPLNENIANRGTDTATFLLAAGIDPSNVVLFRQSDVLEHTGLLWLLLCRTPASRLMRMIQWQVGRARIAWVHDSYSVSLGKIGEAGP